MRKRLFILTAIAVMAGFGLWKGSAEIPTDRPSAAPKRVHSKVEAPVRPVGALFPMGTGLTTLAESPIQLRDQAATLLKGYRLTEAITRLEALLRQHPGDAKTWLLLARAHRLLGHPMAFLVAFEESKKLDPQNQELWLELGEASWDNIGDLRLESDYRTAHRAFRKSLELNHSNYSAWDSILELTDFKGMEPGYAEGIFADYLDPDDAARLSARVHGLRGEKERGIQELRELLDREGKSPRTERALAEALYDSDRFEEAEAVLESGNFETPEQLSKVVLIKGRLGDIAGAQEKLMELRERFPEYPAVNQSLAFAADELGDTEEAIRLLEGEIQRRPTNVPSMAYLAELLARSGRWDEGQKRIADFLANPANAEAPLVGAFQMMLAADELRPPGKSLAEYLNWIRRADNFATPNPRTADPWRQARENYLSLLGP